MLTGLRGVAGNGVGSGELSTFFFEYLYGQDLISGEQLVKQVNGGISRDLSSNKVTHQVSLLESKGVSIFMSKAFT